LWFICRQLENKQRRITNISECEILPDGSRRLHKLYEYHITDNRWRTTASSLKAEHRKCEEISESLRRRFIENGMPLGELAQFIQGRRKMNDYDPADCLHRHDRRAFYGTAYLAHGTERQHLSRLTAAPGSIRTDINETTRRKKAGFLRREITEAQAVWQPPDGQTGSPWCALHLCSALHWEPASPLPQETLSSCRCWLSV
jgi:hypothetical protein